MHAVAHDLRNLLQAMMGYAWTASVATEHPIVREHLDRVQRAAGDAIELINGLTAGPAPDLSGARCDVAPEIRDIMALLEPSMPARTRLVAELDEPALARIAPADLRQVVLNLVLNAGQAMLEQGGTIRVRAARDDDGITLEVSDDGPGIPEALFERVFEPHFTTRAAGTGHGLPTVLELVERAGGRVELEAVTPHGARFVVHLPAAT